MRIDFIGCAPSNFRKGRLTPYRPEAIVIHIMAGSLRGTDLWFGSAASGVSAHYGVGKSGDVHQYVQEEDTAFHAGNVDNPHWTIVKTKPGGSYVNPNFYTVGIEHEGQVSDTWTEAMLAASSELIASIAARWGIPIDRQHVIGHHQIREVKPCPGEHAPLDELIRRASQMAAPSPSGITQVTAITNLKLRAGAPNTTVAVRRVVVPGTVLTVAECAVGESVSANPNWYKDPSGDFFWAGGTDRPNPSA